MALTLISPTEMLLHIAKQAKQMRLLNNFTQRTLAERSGVSLGTIKKFEHTGKI